MEHEVWVFRPSLGELMRVNTDDGDHERFAAEFCSYFPEDIYFIAGLVSI
jgi:hypothetical protein